MKQKITLSIQDDLIEKMKVHAVYAKRSVSDITEELYREYLDLDRQRKSKQKPASKS